MTLTMKKNDLMIQSRMAMIFTQILHLNNLQNILAVLNVIELFEVLTELTIYSYHHFLKRIWPLI